LGGYMCMAIVLYFFTVSKVFGATFQSGISKIWPTILACFRMWVLQGFFRGDVNQAMPAYVTYIGCANLLVFLWLVYLSKSGPGTMLCAVAYDIGFMTAFNDSDCVATYSTIFMFRASGIAVNCMIATSLALLVALLPSLDLGSAGTVRKHYESQVTMMGNLFDRVKAIMIALTAGDFAESHKTMMTRITPACKSVTIKVQTILMEAVAELATAFVTVRKTLDTPIHEELHLLLSLRFHMGCWHPLPPGGSPVQWWRESWQLGLDGSCSFSPVLAARALQQLQSSSFGLSLALNVFSFTACDCIVVMSRL